MTLANTDHRRLRIAVFNRSFAKASGGAERYAIELVQQLAHRHEIHVFAQDVDHDWPGVTYHRVSAPLRKPRWVNQLWFATATWWRTRRGFDVVHSHENTWHGQVQTVHVLPVWHTLFRGRQGLRWLAKWVGVALSPRLLTYLALERLRVRRGDKHLVVTSPSLGEVVQQTFGQLARPLTTITPGVDLPAPTTAELRRAAREQLGVPVAGRYLLLVANDYEKKGLMPLLVVQSQLSKQEYPELRVLVVGNRNQQARFAAEASKLGIGDRVHFVGPLKDVSVAYRAADVLVHPTWEDTFAMVVLEAMAHGLPVVVSGPRYCGIAGLLTDGQHALLLHDPHDERELLTQVRRLLADPALAHDLGQRARTWAQDHSWPQVAAVQEALYFSVAGRST